MPRFSNYFVLIHALNETARSILRQSSLRVCCKYMIPKPNTERIVYLLLIVLSLLALGMTLASRSYSIDNDVVYKGF